MRGQTTWIMIWSKHSAQAFRRSRTRAVVDILRVVITMNSQLLLATTSRLSKMTAEGGIVNANYELGATTSNDFVDSQVQWPENVVVIT